jgi:predicted phosphodiesterase
MRLAAFSDVHGNWIAFQAMLADLESVGEVDSIWFLGDLAAFGSRPVECIRKVREMAEQHGEKKFRAIGGNTDRYLVRGDRHSASPADTAEALASRLDQWRTRDTVLNWNLSLLAWEDYEFLSRIIGHETGTSVKDYGRVIGYHGIPGSDEGYLTPETPAEEALDALLDREGRLGIGGHIHVQMDRDLGRWRAVNIGSVGFSRDMPGKAQWGLLTFEGDQVTVDLRAVPYDLDAAIADLHDAGHPVPDWLAKSLHQPGG